MKQFYTVKESKAYKIIRVNSELEEKDILLSQEKHQKDILIKKLIYLRMKMWRNSKNGGKI